MSKQTKAVFKRNDEARVAAEIWLKGWCTGTVFGVIPVEYIQHADFAAGWAAGRTAAREAKQTAEQLYSVTFPVLKPVDSGNTKAT